MRRIVCSKAERKERKVAYAVRESERVFSVAMLRVCLTSFFFFLKLVLT